MTSDPAPNDDSGERARAEALSIRSRLNAIEDALPTNFASIHEAVARARRAVQDDSVTAALREESAWHITARTDYLIAALHDLLVTSEHLVEQSEKLRREARALSEAIEGQDDDDL